MPCYRDPNVLKTVKAYDRTAEFLRNIDLNEDALTKAIVGAIGNVDKYMLPDRKGATALNRYVW